MVIIRDNEIYATESDVRNFINVYDSNEDERLSYIDFLNLVLPNTSPALRKLCTSRNSYYISRNDKLPYETEWALARVIHKEIDFFRKSELLKEELVSRYDFDNLNAFRTIDVDRIGFLTHDTIYFFLKRLNIIASDDDILAILRRIVIEGDAKIVYSDFLNAILPQDPYYKARKPSISNIDYKSASPTRKIAVSPTRKIAVSPTRKIASPNLYSSNKKITNIDYIDYLNQSTKKSMSKTKSKFNSSGGGANIDYIDYLTQSSKKSMSKTTSKFNSSGSGAFTPGNKNNSKLRNRDLYDSLAKTRSTYVTPTKRSASVVGSTSKLTSNKKALTSAMKDNEEQHLAFALKDQIDNERVLENMKNEIALKNDFNTFDAFRFFDISGKGYITKSEFKESLCQFNIFPTGSELFLIMKKYDMDGDSLIK